MGFQIDENKLRGALPPPVSSTSDDLKWSAAFLSIPAMALALIAFVLWLLLS